MSTDEILTARGRCHGPYALQAALTQRLKSIICSDIGNFQRMADDQRDALEMIATKIGRILVGDPNHVDHWDDIAGYARLVARRLANAGPPNEA